MGRPTNGHSIIIGGGIAGLLAAHALAGRFERVTILERFRYPPDSTYAVPPARRGVPQSRCIHVLMATGATAIDKLAPGWSHHLAALGVDPFDACSDAVLRLPAGWLPRTRSGITTYACSRAALEKALLAGLADTSTVHLRQNQKVLGLVSSPRGDRVTGVCTVEREGARETTLLADLVIDASGEGSALPRWLSCFPNGGRLRVDKTVVDSGMQYVSCWFNIEPEDAPNWHSLSIAPTTSVGLRSAMMVRAEQNLWGVVLLAPVGEPLPTDETSFLDFAASFRDGKLRKALARARPASPVLRFGATANRLMHYECLSAWPAGLAAIGDSVCTLNPYFGLGMTMAARGAVLLSDYLDKQRGGVVSGSGFQSQLAAMNAQPWRIATGRHPDGRMLVSDTTQLGRLQETAQSNPKVAHALLAVQHLIRPVETLEEGVV